jgi:hypothetical protein
MSRDNVKKQIIEAREKIRRAKEQIASLEKAVDQMEVEESTQSEGRNLAQQHRT